MYSSRTTFDSSTKIWHGTKIDSVFDSKTSLGDIFIYSASHHPDKIIQISDNNGVQLTNRDVLERSVKISLNLQKLGIKPKDVIGIVARNTPNLISLVAASFFCGTPFNALDVFYGKDEIVHVFGWSKPKIIFCDEDKLEMIEDVLEKLRLSSNVFTLKGRHTKYGSIEDFLINITDEEMKDFRPHKIQDSRSEIAAICCTSGTTGYPKGANLTHFAILQGVEQFFFKSDDVFWNLSSLHWISGIWGLCGQLVHGIRRIITDEPFSSELVLKCIKKYRPSVCFFAPAHIARMLADPEIEATSFDCVKKFIAGGGIIPVTLVKNINKYLRNTHFSPIYGLTEAETPCASGIIQTRLGSVGQLGINISIKILDETGNQLGPNQDGEVVIKTSHNFLGYYNNPDETNNVLDKDGWIHSGDIGHFDDDGFLFVIDRKKDILKYNFFQFWPSEIENKIMEIDGIEHACVCGIPNILTVDLPAAAVVKRKKCDIREKDISDFIAKEMSDHKQLRGGVYFVDSIPLTNTGKISRNKVREMVLELYNERRNNNGI